MPTCREFEARLEALASPGAVSLPALPAEERFACLRHAANCPACRELLELARIGTAPAAGGAPAGEAEELVAAVMAGTSGPACERARERLAAAWGAVDDDLLALHVESCAGCRTLAGVLESLAADLPRLAELPPDETFVDDVLAATLPLPVRLRRWWAATGERVARRTWEGWVRRPRFALEAAFVVTLAFLPLIVASGPNLAAAPAKGAQELVRIAREAPDPELDRLFQAEGRGEIPETIGLRLDGTLREIRGSRAAQRTERRFGAVGESFRRVGAALAEGYGTLRSVAASYLTKGGEDASSPETNDTPPVPNAPASEETIR